MRSAECGVRNGECGVWSGLGHDAMLLDLAAAQERTNEIVESLAERHVELAEQHKVSEQTLNGLISSLERHITTQN